MGESVLKCHIFIAKRHFVDKIERTEPGHPSVKADRPLLSLIGHFGIADSAAYPDTPKTGLNPSKI
jgi:hypothetical protein